VVRSVSILYSKKKRVYGRKVVKIRTWKKWRRRIRGLFHKGHSKVGTLKKADGACAFQKKGSEKTSEGGYREENL